MKARLEVLQRVVARVSRCGEVWAASCPAEVADGACPHLLAF